METTHFLNDDKEIKYTTLENALSKFHTEQELKILEPYIEYIKKHNYEYPHVIVENVLRPEFELEEKEILEKKSYAIFYRALEERISTPILTYWTATYKEGEDIQKTKNMSRFREHATPIIAGKENPLLQDFFTKVSREIQKGHDMYGKAADINMRIHNGFVYEKTGANIQLYDPVAQELMSRIKEKGAQFLNDLKKETQL